jgi:hypothetical protein
MPIIIVPRWVEAVEDEWRFYKRFPNTWALLKAWGLA